MTTTTPATPPASHDATALLERARKTLDTAFPQSYDVFDRLTEMVALADTLAASLTAAQARVAELERENEQLRSALKPPEYPAVSSGNFTSVLPANVRIMNSADSQGTLRVSQIYAMCPKCLQSDWRTIRDGEWVCRFCQCHVVMGDDSMFATQPSAPRSEAHVQPATATAEEVRRTWEALRKPAPAPTVATTTKLTPTQLRALEHVILCEKSGKLLLGTKGAKLRTLRDLELKGVVEFITETHEPYRMGWTSTDLGRAALSATDARTDGGV